MAGVVATRGSPLHPPSASAISPTVLVVEDDADLRSAVRRYLSEEGFTVEEAESGDEALAVLLDAARGGPVAVDAVVLDLLLPRLNGREVCYRLRRAGCWVPVLIATAFGEVDDRILGFQDGADDYLVKPFSLAELTLRLRAVLRRTSPGGDGRLVAGELRVDLLARRAWSGPVEVTLSPRELEVLAFFVRRPGIVLSREVVRRGVWGAQASISSNSVDQHIAHLRRKLDWSLAGAEIETVQGVGYRLRVVR